MTEPSAGRLARYRAVAAHLAGLDDRALRAAVTAAVPGAAGIGGRTAELEIGGTRVFVKRVPLTEPETRLRTTANLFGLPTFYQYGIGSAGFGAWRELEAHVMTTEWVLNGEFAGFPLLYHWRVIPDRPPEGFADEFGGIDGAVAHWEGSPAVRERLTAIGRAAYSLVLFLEHLPATLAGWLAGRGPEGHAWALRELERAAAFLRSRGFVHFDAHFRNVLTDGRTLYFADLGLAVSSQFDLSADEAAFLARHLTYDLNYTVGHLLEYHVLSGTAYEAFLSDWLAGRARTTPAAEAILRRYARTALAMHRFQRRLLHESKRTPYPEYLEYPDI